MAEVLQPPKQPAAPAHAMSVTASPERSKPGLPPGSIAIPVAAPTTQQAQPARSGHLNLDVFSPVNQNGSFEFDRVIKSGHVHKRSRKTRQWKSFYLVLRPNLLSMYKNESEEKLLKQIVLSELTAAAFLKDPKGRRQHMFGLFTPAHNYQFQAKNDSEAREWIDLIRSEARIDEEEESMIFGSPPPAANQFDNPYAALNAEVAPLRPDQDRLASSSPEPAETPIPSANRENLSRVTTTRQSSMHELDYSGQEHGSYSDFSDTAPVRAALGTSTTSIPLASTASTVSANTKATTDTNLTVRPPNASRNPSQISTANSEAVKNNSLVAASSNAPGPVATAPGNAQELDDERVIWQGYLLCLKSKGGVRQWKRLWLVLRPKHLAFYKNEDEYAPHLILPLPTVLSAIEIDPVSRSKRHCLQIIAEERNYRFCAPSEEALARCLGALKSLLARRKERERRVAAAKAAVKVGVGGS